MVASAVPSILIVHSDRKTQRTVQRILGVTPAEPGFSRIAIAPNRCGLAHAKGSVCTPRGLVEVAWRVEGKNFTIEAVAPANTPVQVQLPDGSHRDFSGGRASFTVSLP